MVLAPYILTSNPPQYRYDCKCGQVKFTSENVLSNQIGKFGKD